MIHVATISWNWFDLTKKEILVMLFTKQSIKFAHISHQNLLVRKKGYSSKTPGCIVCLIASDFILIKQKKAIVLL